MSHYLFIIFQAILLFILFFLILSKVKNNRFRWLLSGFFSLLLSFEISSIFLSGGLIDYKFFTHFETETILDIFSSFFVEGISILIIYLLSLISLYKLAVKLRQGNKLKKTIATIGILLCIVGISIEDGAAFKVYQTVKLVNTQLLSFEESLSKLGINPEEYIYPEEVKATAGKNIIVLSLESLEKGYFQDNLSHLVPNLKELAQNNTMLHMPQDEGISWTAGSMYCLLTGLPGYFTSTSNKTFQNTSSVKITGLSHVLNKAGYDMSYLIGRPEFGGMDDLLNAYGVPVKSEHTFSTKYETCRYGVFDKDLFHEAKKEISEKSKSDKPFAVFISTNSTHAVDGIYDERMTEYVDEQRSNLEFMVKATDYMVGDLISFLEQEGILENTIIFIYPDHLLMRKIGHLFKEFSERNLYFLTTADTSSLNLLDKKEVLQIDIPSLILDGAEISHNAKFLSDFIEDENRAQFLASHSETFLSLNEASIRRSFINTPQTVNQDDFRKDVKRFIAHGGGMIDGNTYTNSLEALDLSYKKGFKMFELDIIKTSDNQYVAAHDWKMWQDFTGYQDELPVSLEVFKNHKIRGKYTPMSMPDINKWFAEHPDAILVTDKINEPTKFAEAFIDKDRLIMELFTLDAVKEGLQIGIKSAMPSMRVLNKIWFNKVKVMKELGVKDIAVSRRMVEKNPKLLIDLKKAGIRVYVYHLNYEEEKDEEFVVKNEAGFIYGMYADKWDFRSLTNPVTGKN